MLKKYLERDDEFTDITNGEIKGLVMRRKAENNMFENTISNLEY